MHAARLCREGPAGTPAKQNTTEEGAEVLVLLFEKQSFFEQNKTICPVDVCQPIHALHTTPTVGNCLQINWRVQTQRTTMDEDKLTSAGLKDNFPGCWRNYQNIFISECHQQSNKFLFRMVYFRLVNI
jgi:hypothetical protein